MEAQIFDYLVIAAFVLLLGVSVGIGYLTAIEWRDRRRRDQDTKDARPKSSPAIAAKNSKKNSKKKTKTPTQR